MFAPNHTLQTAPMVNLRKQWFYYVVFAALYLAVFYQVLSRNLGNNFAIRWLTIASLVAIYQCYFVWRNIGSNRLSESHKILPTLGKANATTLFRGLLIASLAGFLTLPIPSNWLIWLPACLYSLAAVADMLDGYLARRTNRMTRLGTELDMSFDGQGVLAAALLLVHYDKVPMVYLLVALARYLFLAGLWLRQRTGRPVYDLPPSRRRQIYASVQFAFIALVLFPIFNPPATSIAGVLFAIPFLVGFLWDWLSASGHIQKPLTQAVTRMYKITPILQIIARISLICISAFTVYQFTRTNPEPAGPVFIIQVLLGFSALMVLIGVAGRVSAGFALVLFGLLQLYTPLNPLQYLQITGYTAIIFLGSGPLALWSPEDHLYAKKLNSTNTQSSFHDAFAQTS